MVTGAVQVEMNSVKSRDVEISVPKQAFEVGESSVSDTTSDEVAEAKAQPNAVCFSSNP
jgi:hypothetical protein